MAQSLGLDRPEGGGVTPCVLISYGDITQRRSNSFQRDASVFLQRAGYTMRLKTLDTDSEFINKN